MKIDRQTSQWVYSWGREEKKVLFGYVAFGYVAFNVEDARNGHGDLTVRRTDNLGRKSTSPVKNPSGRNSVPGPCKREANALTKSQRASSTSFH